MARYQLQVWQQSSIFITHSNCKWETLAAERAAKSLMYIYLLLLWFQGNMPHFVVIVLFILLIKSCTQKEFQCRLGVEPNKKPFIMDISFISWLITESTGLLCTILRQHPEEHLALSVISHWWIKLQSALLHSETAPIFVTFIVKIKHT